MSLQSACIALLLLLITTCTYGQEQPVSRHITGKEGAAGAQVIINEVNNEQYPQVRIFTTVLKEGTPIQGLSAADFRVREEVIGLAREVNAPIYVLGLGTDSDEAGLRAIAQATGALSFRAPEASDLQALYEKIGAQLAGQYAISYTSNLPADGTEHRVALTTQGLTDTKAYKAPHRVKKAAQGQTRPSSGEAPCYDETALQAIVASLRKNQERFARSLINSIERDQRQQQLVNDFDHLMAQGSGTGACLLQQLGLVHTLFNDQLLNSIQRDASRKQLYTKLHNLCLPQATDVPPITGCLTLMNGAFEHDLINSIQRDASRQMLWKALHNVLLARAQTDAEIDQALDVANQLHEQDLINSLQRDETRKALSKK